MKVVALADLHLSLSCPEKDMAVYGPSWSHYMSRIACNWRQVVGPQDWVLICGDITWAMRAEQARLDLEWVDQLPGKKVMIRGNHDYWWGSRSKVQSILPASIVIAERDLVEMTPNAAVVGTRLWDVPGLNFDEAIDWKPSKTQAKAKPAQDPEQSEAIFAKELRRLEESLKLFKETHTVRIAMLHYPPIGLDKRPTVVTELLERYGVNICVFGHLHSLKRGIELFGSLGGIKYVLTSADFLDFSPQLLIELEG